MNRDVMAELAFQRAQRHKRDGMEALNRYDDERAEHNFKDAIRILKKALPNAPRNRRDEFQADIAFIEQMRHRALAEGAVLADREFVNKGMSANITGASRYRGRRGV